MDECGDVVTYFPFVTSSRESAFFFFSDSKPKETGILRSTDFIPNTPPEKPNLFLITRENKHHEQYLEF